MPGIGEAMTRNKTAHKPPVATPIPEGSFDLGEVRRQLGQLWGLDRAITKTELARALKLSPGHGSDFIRKVERGAASLSGTAEVAISMMLGGARPPTMDDVIKPGYPRGSRWNLDAPEPETPAGPETTA